MATAQDLWKRGRARWAVPILLAGTAMVPVALASSAAATSGSTSAGEDDAVERYVACMRDNGQPDFPDATVTDDGRIVLDTSDGSLELFSDDYRAAREACRDELPDGAAFPEPPAAPDMSGLDDLLDAFDREGCAPEAPVVPAVPTT